ncbi:MAG: DNA repair protein RecN [Thioalkalivibrionaceae bacterium]
MLTSLSIQNFAIIERATLDFAPGMSALTGETGAGKSILVDAIGLLLGDRGEASAVGNFGDEAILVAHFQLTPDHAATASDPSDAVESIGGRRSATRARQWLTDNGFDPPTPTNELLIRRRISANGKGRAWINDQPATMSQLRGLGERLVAIHGQHAHHQLLGSTEQRRLLDRFVDADLLAAVRESATRLNDLQARRRQLAERADARRDRLELLRFQLEELDQLAPSESDFSEVQAAQRRLSHAEERRAALASALETLDDDGAESLLLRARQQIEVAARHAPEHQNLIQRIDEIIVLLQELTNDLRAEADDDGVDPAALHDAEQRLDDYLRIARKHRVTPENLAAHHRTLNEESKQLTGESDAFEQLDRAIDNAKEAYEAAARRLRASRLAAADRLAANVTRAIQALGMPGGQFFVDIVPDDSRVSIHGTEDIAFVVQTNPGSPKGALDRVASGGELSRIGLALQVLGHQEDGPPTLIFDEVDTGISGRVADIVGRHLRALGRDAQVLCVTHLAQVAACAHQHIEIRKTHTATTTRTEAHTVDGEDRIDALASLLGGAAAGESARATARDLLSAASRSETPTET